jgi:hypothetical protein
MMPNKCDHYLGYINEHDGDENGIYVNCYIQTCIETAKMANETNQHFFEVGITKKRRVINPVDYIDSRRGMARLYNHCPDCGEKINWTKLRKALREASNAE